MSNSKKKTVIKGFLSLKNGEILKKVNLSLYF